MIIEFSIGNYRSFNEIQTLSFRATSLSSGNSVVDENNVVEVAGQQLLKTIGIYGPNGSGKSNLLKGLHFFKRMVKWSLDNEELIESIFNPNKQSILNDQESACFNQIVLLLDGKKYRYGFTVKKKNIAEEWLFGPAGKNETFYFTRKGMEIDVNNKFFPEGVNIPFETKLRENTLFLTFCSSYNGKISGAIREYISSRIKHAKLIVEEETIDTNALVEQDKKELVLKWLHDAGLVYNDIELQKKFVRTNQHTYRLIDSHPVIILYKPVYSKETGQQESIQMNLFLDESEGTQKFYTFIGKLYNKFENGGLFVSDEIDSNFHPALLIKIISMFNNPAINKANAQLLFTSHDTNLMSPDIMRRDQFYFTEKSSTDSTFLYSLANLKGIRNNADFAKQYLAGYYGALPILGNYNEEQTIVE